MTSVNTFTCVLQGCLPSLCVFSSGEIMLSILIDAFFFFLLFMNSY